MRIRFAAGAEGALRAPGDLSFVSESIYVRFAPFDFEPRAAERVFGPAWGPSHSSGRLYLLGELELGPKGPLPGLPAPLLAAAPVQGPSPAPGIGCQLTESSSLVRKGPCRAGPCLSAATSPHQRRRVQSLHLVQCRGTCVLWGTWSVGFTTSSLNLRLKSVVKSITYIVGCSIK